MSSLPIALLNLEVDDLLLWLPEAGTPVDRDNDVLEVASAAVKDALVAHSAVRPGSFDLVVDTLLDQARNRESDFTATHNVLDPVTQLVHTWTTDSDGRMQRDVSALIHDSEDTKFAIPLSLPLDKPLLYLLRGLHGDDLVRVLTELIRILGDTVRLFSLPDRARGNVVRALRQLIGLARSALSKESDDEATCADECGHHDSSDLPTSHAQNASASKLPSDDRRRLDPTRPAVAEHLHNDHWGVATGGIFWKTFDNRMDAEMCAWTHNWFHGHLVDNTAFAGDERRKPTP